MGSLLLNCGLTFYNPFVPMEIVSAGTCARFGDRFIAIPSKEYSLSLPAAFSEDSTLETLRRFSKDAYLIGDNLCLRFNLRGCIGLLMRPSCRVSFGLLAYLPDFGLIVASSGLSPWISVGRSVV